MATSSRRRPYSLRQHAIDTNYSLDFTDRTIGLNEDRVSAIEEALAAPWPRLLPALLRLRRQIRASVAPYTAEPDFRRRRMAWMAEQIDRTYGSRLRAVDGRRES